jgi:dUTP pyrophosphatase
MERIFLIGCHKTWQGKLKEATEKGDMAAIEQAKEKLAGIEKTFHQTCGEHIPSTGPSAAPAAPAESAPSKIEALLQAHAEQSKALQARHGAQQAGGPGHYDTSADDASVGHAYDELEDIEKQYKELTGMDVPGTVVERTTVPVTPAAPSPALFLDLYPNGNGFGLPMCVTAKIVDLVCTRDPADSGVDLPTPAAVTVPPHTTVRIKLGVRATVRSAITYLNAVTGTREGLMVAARRKPYWLAPRSSLSKTPLILANSIGVIDAGYNGELQAAMHNTSDKPYEVKQLDRLVQIVSGDLTPFYRITVRGQTERPDKTTRGDGGYGSTGK